MGILERFSLRGRTALVTGGGQGTIVDLNPDTAASVAAEVEQLGRRSLAVVADVSDAEQVGEMVARVIAAWGRLDIGVNNAGVRCWAAAEEMTVPEWDDLMAVNLKAVFLCCQAEARVMLAQGYGKIINTASMSAHIVNRPQKQVGYNTSKAGVVHLTRSLAASTASARATPRRRWWRAWRISSPAGSKMCRWAAWGR